eukprot:m.208391 g.208391  ORF g.208391 m.208391 type:complete len:261 (+) comp15041_c0_seq7:140-922(+)
MASQPWARSSDRTPNGFVEPVYNAKGEALKSAVTAPRKLRGVSTMNLVLDPTLDQKLAWQKLNHKPKDHLALNKKKLKETQRANRQRKEAQYRAETPAADAPFKPARFATVESKVAKQLAEPKQPTRTYMKKHQGKGKPSTPSKPTVRTHGTHPPERPRSAFGHSLKAEDMAALHIDAKGLQDRSDNPSRPRSRVASASGSRPSSRSSHKYVSKCWSKAKRTAEKFMVLVAQNSVSVVDYCCSTGLAFSISSMHLFVCRV